MCILWLKWAVMYLYTTVQVSGHVFVYYGSSERSYICILWVKWSVMYLYTTVQVISHVFAYCGSSDQSCICIVLFKRSVMYFYTTVQVVSHVFVYYGSSERSCICVLRVSPLYLPPIFLLDFELFPTVWYFSIIFWTISDSVVFLFLFFILSAIMFSLYVLYYDIFFS